MPCLPRVAFSLGSTTQAYLLLQLVWFSGLVRECGASGTQQFDFWASSKRLKSIQSGNCMSWKQVHRPWHSWWLCCQESVRTSDLLFTWERCPSVSLSQTLRLWPSVPWECWGVTEQMLLLKSQFPEVTLSFFTCLWLAKCTADSPQRQHHGCILQREHAALKGYHSGHFPSRHPRAMKLICC